MKKSLCLILAYSLALQPIAPVFAAGDTLNTSPSQIGAGDTAKSLPDVSNICKRLKGAQEGNFVDTSGNSILVTRDDCLNKPRRERNKPECKIKVSDLLAGITNNEAKQAKINALCGTGTGSLGQAGEAYCALRQATKDGQSLKYCEAHEAASKAQKGLRWLLALDAAAAGVCWAEFLATKAQIKNGAQQLGAKGLSGGLQSGACGGVALAAGMGEILHTSKVLLTGDKSAGKYKVDSNNNVKKRDGFLTTIEVVLSAGLSARAVKIGVCYYKPDHKICGDIAEKAENRALKSKSGDKHKAFGTKYSDARMQADANKEEGAQQAVSANSFEDFKQGADKMKKGLEAEKNLDRDRMKYNRALMAQEAAKIFTALTAMRGIAIMAAGKTKKTTEELLQSMLQSGGGPSFGSSAMSGSGNGLFTSLEGSGFASTSNQPNQSGVTAAPPGSIESFLTPPGSPLGNAAENIARQIPESKLDGAAEGGAGGLSGLVSSIASGSGAKGDLSEIRGVMNSAFANMPKEEGGYGGSGGGRPLASRSDTGDLKSLFGAGEKEGETSAGRTDIAYRDPAAEEDIWHSQNPSGNNIFQIISEKYDRVQRKSAIGNDL